ncbi:hypothetical protein B0H16DRAFT_1459281 [Mycena metata]|uniref:Uncharacterized protein n=1 Tax=Mycena metata TaxID=1033252 RepID=A0AAD7NBW6_9AGAR|nr:hypothetical protein B0H16DRAFT_1459281 [Mycena metata]
MFYHQSFTNPCPRRLFNDLQPLPKILQPKLHPRAKKQYFRSFFSRKIPKACGCLVPAGNSERPKRPELTKGRGRDTELADAMGVRLRYLARHHLILPSSVGAVFSSDGLLQSTSAYKVAPPSARPSVATPSSVTVHADHVATPSFIPVHADRGPDPARNAESPDELLTTTTTMKAFGPYREVVGKLVFGHPDYPSIGPRNFPVVFDLDGYTGKSSEQLRRAPMEPLDIRPFFGSHAMRMRTSNSVTELAPSTTSTAPLPVGRPHPYEIHSFSKYDPFGECLFVFPYTSKCPFQRKESPEMTILLGRNFGFALIPRPTNTLLIANSYITFGRRPVLSGPNTGDWHNCIPILGDEHWMFSSRIKKLNGIEYISSNGTAELDTGAPRVILFGTTSCYVGDDFVSAYYAQIPGSTTKFLGPQTQHLLYHLIPMTVGKTTPRVEFDIGGSMFILKHSHLPKCSKELAEATNYYVGALQHQSLLNGPGGAYNGPDIIGRVALVNMEIVLQMPENRPHTMSWRRRTLILLGRPRSNDLAHVFLQGFRFSMRLPLPVSAFT